MLALYVALCALLFLVQRSLIYYPQPGRAGGAQTIALAAPDAALNVGVRPHPGHRAVLYFGGNAEDVGGSLPTLAAAFPDRALFLMHYRGYGGSSGAPSERALVDDAVRLFDHAFAEHPDVTVVGRSLGSGVAAQLAARRPVARVVLVTPYDSVEALAAAQFPFVPVRWLLRDRFDSASVAPRIAVPTTLVIAEHDEVIPRANSERLRERFAPGVASWRVLPRTGHNSISESPEYLDALRGDQPARTRGLGPLSAHR
nr:alpha/beta fold hydrolase [Schlegelella koreensis]